MCFNQWTALLCEVVCIRTKYLYRSLKPYNYVTTSNLLQFSVWKDHYRQRHIVSIIMFM